MINNKFPPADMLINEISKLFDDSIRRKSVNYPSYEHFGGKKGFGARHILFRLAENKDRGINQRTLVQLTHLTAPTVSVALQKMEVQGLIKREQNPDDMRETMVCITEKGLDFHDFIRRSISETQQQMFSDFTDEETELLRSLLMKIKKNMTEGGAVEDEKTGGIS